MATWDVAVAVRCSEWSRAIGADPIGTAGAYETVVVVEWPVPWPRDVLEVPALAPLAALPGTRVLLTPPTGGTDGTLVTVWRREGRSTFEGRDHRVPGDRLTASCLQILGGGGPSAGSPAPEEVLICGHGQRDRCCGSLGVRLIARCGHRWPGVRVRRCSHLGGHRFAPTGVTFPAGRVWGFLDADVLDAVVGGVSAPGRVLQSYRGSLALPPVAQVAERALLRHLGARWNAVDIGPIEVTAVGDEHHCRVSWTDRALRRSATVVVRPGPTVTTPDCGAPLGDRPKTAQEWLVTSFSTAGD